jgi:hypothetical protein
VKIYRLNSNILFFFLIFIFFSCKTKQEENISDVPVNFTIDINDPLYREIRTIGNSITVIGGHAGIVIYRFSQDEFIAFDRLCPVEKKTSCQIQPTDDDLFYTCECCNTPYLMIDGTGQSKNDTVFAGTGKFLKEYRTYYDGISQVRITNF